MAAAGAQGPPQGEGGWEAHVVTYNVRSKVSANILSTVEARLGVGADSPALGVAFLGDIGSQARLLAECSERPLHVLRHTEQATSVAWVCTTLMRDVCTTHSFKEHERDMAGLTVEVDGDRLHLLGLYWRPGDKGAGVSTATIDKAWLQMEDACGAGRRLLLGDLNAHLGASSSTKSNVSKARGKTLAEWMDTDAVNMVRLYGVGADALPTHFISRDGEYGPGGVLDHIIVEASDVDRYKLDEEGITRAGVGPESDHALVHVVALMQGEAPREPAPRSVTRVVKQPARADPAWHEYGLALQDKLAEMVPLMQKLGVRRQTPQHLQVVYDAVVEVIYETAGQAFGTSEPAPGPAGRNRNSPLRRLQRRKQAVKRRMRLLLGDAAVLPGRQADFDRLKGIAARMEAEAVAARTAAVVAARKRKATEIGKELLGPDSAGAWRNLQRIADKRERTAATLGKVADVDGDLVRAGPAAREAATAVLTKVFEKRPAPPAVAVAPQGDTANDAVTRLREALAHRPLQRELKLTERREGVASRRLRGERPAAPWQLHEYDQPSEGGLDFRGRVESALGKLRRRSSPGADGLTAELLCYGDSHAMALQTGKPFPGGGAAAEGAADAGVDTFATRRALARVFAPFFEACVAAGWVPAQWRVGASVLLSKGGDQHADLTAYRPITCGSVMEKWFSHSVLPGIEAWAVKEGRLQPQQCGFRSNASREDCLLNVTSLLAERHGPEEADAGNITHHLYVDFKGAYDSVHQEGLLLMLSEIGVGDKAVALFRAMLTGRTTRFRVAGGMTGEVPLGSGVPQGHVLSPMLFSLFLDGLLREVKLAAAEVDADWALWCVLGYADDILFRAGCLEHMQTLLDAARRYAEQWGLTVNLKKGKTEHCVFGEAEGTETGQLRYGHELVRKAPWYKYLGVILDPAQWPSMKRHMDKVWGFTNAGHHVVRAMAKAFPSLAPGLKIKAWKAINLPRLISAVGSWDTEEDAEEWARAQGLLRRAARELLGAGRGAAQSVLEAEAGLQNISYYRNVNRLRLVSAMLRSPAPATVVGANGVEALEEPCIARQTLAQMIKHARGPQQGSSLLWRLVGWCEAQGTDSDLLNKVAPALCGIISGTVQPEDMPQLHPRPRPPPPALGDSDEAWGGEDVPSLEQQWDTGEWECERFNEWERTWGLGTLVAELERWKTEMKEGKANGQRLFYLKNVNERRLREKGTLSVRTGTIRSCPKALWLRLPGRDHRLLGKLRRNEVKELRAGQGADAVHEADGDDVLECPCCGDETDNPAHLVTCWKVASHKMVAQAWDGMVLLMRSDAAGQPSLEHVAKWVRLAAHSEVPGHRRDAASVMLGSSNTGNLPSDLADLWRTKVLGPGGRHSEFVEAAMGVWRACLHVHGLGVAGQWVADATGEDNRAWLQAEAARAVSEAEAGLGLDMVVLDSGSGEEDSKDGGSDAPRGSSENEGQSDGAASPAAPPEQDSGSVPPSLGLPAPPSPTQQPVEDGDSPGQGSPPAAHAAGAAAGGNPALPPRYGSLREMMMSGEAAPLPMLGGLGELARRLPAPLLLPTPPPDTPPGLASPPLLAVVTRATRPAAPGRRRTEEREMAAPGAPRLAAQQPGTGKGARRRGFKRGAPERSKRNVGSGQPPRPRSGTPDPRRRKRRAAAASSDAERAQRRLVLLQAANARRAKSVAATRVKGQLRSGANKAEAARPAAAGRGRGRGSGRGRGVAASPGSGAAAAARRVAGDEEPAQAPTGAAGRAGGREGTQPGRSRWGPPVQGEKTGKGARRARTPPPAAAAKPTRAARREPRSRGSAGSGAAADGAGTHDSNGEEDIRWGFRGNEEDRDEGARFGDLDDGEGRSVAGGEAPAAHGGTSVLAPQRNTGRDTEGHDDDGWARRRRREAARAGTSAAEGEIPHGTPPGEKMPGNCGSGENGADSGAKGGGDHAGQRQVHEGQGGGDGDDWDGGEGADGDEADEGPSASAHGGSAAAVQQHGGAEDIYNTGGRSSQRADGQGALSRRGPAEGLEGESNHDGRRCLGGNSEQDEDGSERGGGATPLEEHDDVRTTRPRQGFKRR